MKEERPVGRLVFRVHAIQRMFKRGINEADVRHVLAAGEVIEDYPDDLPYPSRLMLGWCGTRPIHVVAVDNTAEDETIVITVYEPDPRLWEPGFKRRRT
jgi:hypothetical protein